MTDSALETGHAACFGHLAYYYSTTTYGHPESLFLKAPGSLGAAIILSAFIVFCVQSFFTFRIYILSTSKPLALLFAVLTVVWFVISAAIGVGAALEPSIPIYKVKWGNVALASLGGSAATDLLIALTLVWLLSRERSGYKRTHDLVAHLIKWTIGVNPTHLLVLSLTLGLETGLLTSFSSLLTAILYGTMTTNLIWLALFAIKARLFANSCFASLNARVFLRTQAALPMSIQGISVAVSEIVISSQHSSKPHDSEQATQNSKAIAC
ncbi:MYND-type domain-containing protein [Mycena indigotica]|uniref:MYND-type domain-containing protein n=1 Tax=Mycena indigotica TaxID=2126181 RepID=A0A8H6RYL1_9AGAR|nr:MYND-type domain-containing protein [Mycena indigotica]KAF7289318.1 MYND-type domain-containing protein [Mycena indigotica]